MLSDFYIIRNEHIGQDCAEFDVLLNPDCKVYKGHFPGEPVSPGVCSIQMVKECAEKMAGARLCFVQIKQCRFQQLLSPATTPELKIEISLKQEEDYLNAEAKVMNNGVICVSLKGTLKKEA